MSTTKTFFGHPIGLSTLFATEMWERFSYYGMRALLVYFLTGTLISGGFGMEEADAFTIYGIFTALVYVTPIIGGILADKVLGQRKTIYIGGITMAMGQFMLAASAMTDGNIDTFKGQLFLYGLGILILGNGFFKPNISTMVGELYDNTDSRKDNGFTIFYMGINLGAFLSPLIAGKLGEQVAWEYGFMAAGVGMLIGTLWFLAKSHTLGRVGMPPKTGNNVRLVLKDWLNVLTYAVVIVGGVIGFFQLWGTLGDTIKNAIIITVSSLGLIYLIGSVVKGTKGKTEWSRVSVILVLALFNIFFWSGFEQAGTTFSIFARDNTDRMIGNWEIPATWFQSVNAVFIIALAPVFTVIWAKLDKVKLNPNTPMKFVWGMLLLSLGFVVMAIANNQSIGSGTIEKVSPLWLVLVFLMHTFGELCLSPIGLSMVTKLSPTKLISTMMGVWMGSFAAGNFVASQMKSISLRLETHFDTSIPVFWFIAGETAIAAILLLFLSPWLKKMMEGIK